MKVITNVQKTKNEYVPTYLNTISLISNIIFIYFSYWSFSLNLFSSFGEYFLFINFFKNTKLDNMANIITDIIYGRAETTFIIPLTIPLLKSNA